MQNNSHKTEEVKPLTLALHLDTSHFRAQLAEMAKMAREEFSQALLAEVAMTPAEVREAEGAASRPLAQSEAFPELTPREQYLIALALRAAKREMHELIDALRRTGGI